MTVVSLLSDVRWPDWISLRMGHSSVRTWHCSFPRPDWVFDLWYTHVFHAHPIFYLTVISTLIFSHFLQLILSKFCPTYVHFSLVSRPWPILVCLIQLRSRTMRFWASFWPKRAQSQDLKCHFDPENHNYTNCSWALFWSKETLSPCPTAFY